MSSQSRMIGSIMHKSSWLLVATVVVVSLCVNPIQVAADHDSVHPTLGIQLFLKIISYDENFSTATKGVKVHIIYSKSETASFEQYAEVRDFFADHSGLNISGVSVELVAVEYKHADSFMAQLSDEYYNIMLITDIEKSKVKALIQRKLEREIRTCSFDPEFVSLGVAVSVKPELKKNSILINLKAALVEGSSYGAHLLRMCEIYEEPKYGIK